MGVISRKPVSGAQFGLAVSNDAAGVTLTVPDAAKVAEIYVRTAAIVFTRDGTAPGASKGFQANAADIIMLNSEAECTSFKCIRATGDDAALDIEYFRDVSG